MPSRRDLIRMTDAELRNYLGEQRRIILVTIGPDQMPHPMPMNYGIDGQGRVLITTFRKSQKVKNIERDPRASLLVESGESYHALKSAVLYCDAEILGDPDEVAANMAMVRAEDELATSISPEMNDQVRASLAKRVVLRLTPYRTISWDHAKLSSHY